jgi:hypothetical protein
MNRELEAATRRRPRAERRWDMNKSMFRELEDGEDVTDIIARILAFMAIPAAVFVIAVAIWTTLLS